MAVNQRAPMLRAGSILLSLVLSSAWVSNVNAEPMLLGTIGFGLTPSTLVEIDPASGALVQTIGPVGYVVNGLTFDVTTGLLYGSTSLRDPNYNGLIVIDMATGAGTPIGVDGWGLPFLQAVTNITTNAAGDMYGWWEGTDDLVSIDKTTGVATLVGDSGLSTSLNGLSFDTAGSLLMVNSDGRYYLVDPLTGGATFINSLSTRAHHGDFHPVSNLYYGINENAINPRAIIVADLSTDTEFAPLPTVDDLHTLTFVPVPEPGTLALFGLGLLLAGRNLHSRRRA